MPVSTGAFCELLRALLLLADPALLARPGGAPHATDVRRRSPRGPSSGRSACPSPRGRRPGTGRPGTGRPGIGRPGTGRRSGPIAGSVAARGRLGNGRCVAGCLAADLPADGLSVGARPERCRSGAARSPASASRPAERSLSSPFIWPFDPPSSAGACSRVRASSPDVSVRTDPSAAAAGPFVVAPSPEPCSTIASIKPGLAELLRTLDTEVAGRSAAARGSASPRGRFGLWSYP